MKKLLRLNPHKDRTTYKDKVFFCVIDNYEMTETFFSHAPTVRDIKNLDPTDTDYPADKFEIVECRFVS